MASEDKTSIRSILDRPGKQATSSVSIAESEGESEYSAYAQGRVSRHAQLTLVFRMADGSARAFPYSHLCLVEATDSDTGFTVDFGQCKVRVIGRNLAMLFRLVCQFRVAEMREIDRASGLSLVAEAPVVEKVEFLKALKLTP